MQEVFEQYGRGMLQALIVLLLIFLLWGGMEFSKVPLLAAGSAAMEEVCDAQLQSEFNTPFAETYRLHQCEGVFANTITAGEKTAVAEHLQMTGALGEHCRFRLCQIEGQTQSIPWITEKDEAYFCFEEPGIYTVYFEFWDELGSREYGKVKIPVQRVAA